MRPSLFLACLLAAALAPRCIADPPIRTTSIASLPDDPAADMVAGIDRFLLRKIDECESRRDEYWKSTDAVDANREFLVQRLGIEPRRHPADDGLLFESPCLGRISDFEITRVRWPVLSHPAPQTAAAATLCAEGLHIGNRLERPLAVILPDASERPEQLLLDDKQSSRRRFIAQLVETMDVLIMSTTSREIHAHGGARLSRREYLHRAAFELGRTLTGYEVQMVQAAIDRWDDQQPVIVCGFGEGGMVAMMAGASDTRIDVTMVGDYFGARDTIWQQPLSRQVFGLLERFSDAHLAALIAPRTFITFSDQAYKVELSGQGAAPARWSSPSRKGSAGEFNRFVRLAQSLYPGYANSFACPDGLAKTIPFLSRAFTIVLPESNSDASVQWSVEPGDLLTERMRRDQRQLAMIDAHTQCILAESEYERGQFMSLGNSRTITDTNANQLNTSSPAAYEKSIEPFREHFRKQTIGWFDDPRMPLSARSVQTHRGDGWTGHGVILDVFPDVFAYGELLMPDYIAVGEQRPVVVCQHGLEGRPEDTIIGDHRAYHDFAAKLAEEGFIVFAPQNPYIGGDEFRSLQRKSYPVGKTLFSVIGAQHEQILKWLKTIPNVDPERIAFYGLSYGGKSAMRLPALLPDYCLSICSADFNDWVWKNASTRSRYSYVGTGEYEIFEFGLGKTFNYAEIAALIAPRPFMVERGHFDGVGPDDRVAKEFAKVQHLYNARLKLEGLCEIEWFDGPHTINGQGTFRFLRRHLQWPPNSN